MVGRAAGERKGRSTRRTTEGVEGPATEAVTDEDGIATATDRLSVLPSAGLAVGSGPAEEVAAAPALSLALMSLAFAAWRRACSWALSPECDSPRSRHN